MPEERTVSTFTWLTPSLRAAKKIGQVGAQTQIRQFYATEQKVSLFVTSLNVDDSLSS